jgi:hypothetical protein
MKPVTKISQLVSNHIGVPFIPVSEAHTNLFYICQQYLYIVCIEQTVFGSILIMTTGIHDIMIDLIFGA